MKIKSWGYQVLLFGALVGFGVLLTKAYAASASCKANLTVNINGLSSSSGDARIAVYNSAAAYANAGYSAQGAVRKAAAKISGSSATAVFNGLPCGTYGVKAFHNKDGSGIFRTNAFGIPQQGYAFSNNPRNLMGIPSFNQIAFMLNQNTAIDLSIKGE